MPSDLTAERARIITGSMQYTISAASIQNPNGVVTEPSGSILRAQDGSIWINTDSATAWQNIGPSALNALSGSIDSRLTNVSSSVNVLSGSVDGHFNQLSGTIDARFANTPTGGGVAGIVLFSGASVYSSVNQSIANSSSVAATFDSELYDTDSYHSTTTNTSRLTAPVVGYYHVVSDLEFASSGSGIRTLKLRRNGTTDYTLDVEPGRVTYTTTLKSATTLFLSATDYVESIVFQDSGGSLNLIGASYHQFQMVYMGGSLSGTITFSLGVGGAGGSGGVDGTAGANSTLYYAKVFLTGSGGSGGKYNTNANASGGTGTGGLANGTGGTGGGSTGDNGGGGGGGINGGNNSAAPGGGAGQAGANAVDFQGLSAALAGTGFSLGTGGAGADNSSTNSNAKNGSNGSGVGGGGGGAGWYGGVGGSGSLGGGGGGASAFTQAQIGGKGGGGCLVIRINESSTTVLTGSVTSYVIPSGSVTIQAWLIGAGGGGAGAANSDTVAGGAGGAGGITYYRW